MPVGAIFRTKPQLARLMLGRALESGVPFAWFTGDEVYGSDRNLRLWLEGEGIPHVMAVNPNPPMDGVRTLEGGVRELQARWSGLEFG